MKKITLKFKSPKDLWEFKMIAKLNSVEVNIKSVTLICECEDEEINLATQKYHAHINNEQIALPLY